MFDALKSSGIKLTIFIYLLVFYQNLLLHLPKEPLILTKQKTLPQHERRKTFNISNQ